MRQIKEWEYVSVFFFFLNVGFLLSSHNFQLQYTCICRLNKIGRLVCGLRYNWVQFMILIVMKVHKDYTLRGYTHQWKYTAGHPIWCPNQWLCTYVIVTVIHMVEVPNSQFWSLWGFRLCESYWMFRLPTETYMGRGKRNSDANKVGWWNMGFSICDKCSTPPIMYGESKLMILLDVDCLPDEAPLVEPNSAYYFCSY